MKIGTRLLACCIAVLLSGCSGLNVQWALSASYNTEATTQATMNPGVTDKDKWK